MATLDKENLKKATVYIGETNFHERNKLRDMFVAQGLKQVVCHSNLESLRSQIAEVPPDLLVIADNFDPGIFNRVRDLRVQRGSDNPFMLISMLVSPSRRETLDMAIEAGVDDIIIKPVSSERIQERLKLVIFHRRPFIAIDGYVGPERKADDRNSNVKRFPVINTLLEKNNGREMDKFALKAAVEGSLEKVLQAQLDSQSFRLGEVCVRLVQSYETHMIGEEVLTDLLTLAGVFRGASKVAEKLKDAQLSQLCLSLAKNVDGIADHYDEPSSAEIDLIRKVTAAFSLAMKPAQPKHDAFVA